MKYSDKINISPTGWKTRVLNVYFLPNHLMLSGSDFSKTFHHHYFIQIVISPDQCICAKDKQGITVQSNAIAINSNLVHLCEITGYTLSLFIEPESNLGQTLQGYFSQQNIVSVDSVVSNELLDQIRSFSLLESASTNPKVAQETTVNTQASTPHIPNQSELADAYLGEVKSLFQHLANTIGLLPNFTHQRDPRITNVVNHIATVPDKKVTTTQLARMVGLSDSRLMHLFNDNMGIPIRRYLLWKRLLDGIDLIQKGHPFTYAAIEAGFSDYAHLSKTFKSNFGVNLKSIFKGSTFIHVC